MGKVKRQRLRISRFSPTNLHCSGKLKSRGNLHSGSPGKLKNLSNDFTEDVEAMEDQFLGNGNSHPDAQEGFKTAMNKVSSEMPAERVTGLNMLAAFALELSTAETLMENNIVKLIGPLLKDKNSQVRLGAAGVLRNLSACGSEEVVEMMVQQDILEHLPSLLKTYEANVPNSSISIQEQKSLTFTKGVATSMDESDPHNLTLIHAINVLYDLCVCSEEALRIFNRENLVQILLKHINPYEWNPSISLTAAECLLCVSENNPKAVSAILPYAEMLWSLVNRTVSSTECDSFSLHFAVVIAGVMLNINCWVPEDDNFRQMFMVLSKVLECDVSTILNQPPLPKNSAQTSVHERFGHTVSAQLVAFEILSNICCSDDEEEAEEWEDYNEFSPEQDAPEESMDVENSKQLESLPVEILEGIKFFHLPEKTLQKIVPIPANDLGNISLEKKEEIGEKISQLQIRSLQCLQNLLSCLCDDDFGGSENLYATWLRIGQMSFNDEDKTDPNLLEAASGAMRAIIQKLSERECPQLSSVSTSELQTISSIGLACDVPSVRANNCRMIGTLGCACIKFSQEPELPAQYFDILSMITEHLLKVGREDSFLWVRAEAIDVLIDLYSDDKTDKLAAKVRLVEKLKELHPPFKAKFSQQKRQLGDHQPLVLTVRDNLVGFIKYKGSRTIKYSRAGH